MTSRFAAIQNFIAGLTGWRRNLCALAAGVLATGALPPAHAVPLLLVSFPCLVWLIDGSRRPREAFFAGWWFGFGYFAAGLYWLANAFLVEAETFAWLIPLAVLVLPAALSFFTGAAMAAARLVWTGGPERVAVVALAWCIGEWLRGHLFTGFPWNLIGYVWTFSDAMIQTTAVVGSYGLSLLTVLIAASPAAMAGRDSTGATRMPMILGALLGCVLFAGGMVRLATTGIVAVPDVRLRLVQANVPQDEKWRLDKRRDNFVRHMTMSESSGWDRVTHLIWPETAVPYFIENEPFRLALISRVTPPGGMVLTGAARLNRGGKDEFELWNSFHAIDPHGKIVASYDKSHLVPFGEYLPLRSVLGWFGIDKLVPGGTDFSPGPGVRTLKLPGLPPVSVLICYEAIFPAAVADPRDRPQWLLNITNDAWYGRSAGPYQHLDMTRLRAVEEGVPLVRSAGTGISAVIDPLGRIVRSIGLGERGVLDAELPAALSVIPPYARFGDWTLLMLLAVLAVGGLASHQYRKQ
ncbi:MAG: apolipoprotein N-acyltransferase [Sphingomonadales bacterium]